MIFMFHTFHIHDTFVPSRSTHWPAPGPPAGHRELSMLVDDFSGSVMGDTEIELPTRAFVELTRAFMHAYKNPGALPRRASPSSHRSSTCSWNTTDQETSARSGCM